MKSSKPIGIFDSGVGGISVLKRIRDELPNEDLLYLADSAYAPYGNKSESFIEDRSIFLTRFLVNLDVKAVVVACNTATASAISKIRSMFGLPIIGMEPAVKPAVAATRSGVVGILATEGTLNSTKFSILKQRFGKGTRLITQPCPGLVEQVEQGEFSESLTRDLVESYVSPLVKQNVDIIVLGCTHYPFLSEIIEEVAGPGIKIIDTGAEIIS